MIAMSRTIPFWLTISAALSLAVLGLMLVATADAGDAVHLEIGGALISGVVLSGAFLLVERRIEEVTTERQTRDQYQLDLAMERDLTDRDLSGLKLAQLQLSDRDLTGPRLARSNLSKTRLSRSTLRRADLWEANLSGAHLWKQTTFAADLGRANLTDAILSGADLTEAKLNEADLTGARWNPDVPPKWPEGFDPPKNAWNPKMTGRP